MHLRQRPRSRLLRALAGGDIAWTFPAWGGSLAPAEIREPIRFRVLFPGRPEDGACLARVVLSLGSLSPVYLVRVGALVRALLKDDERALERIDFSRGFPERDGTAGAWAELVDGLDPAS